MAVQRAKDNNMPAGNIDRAIKRGSGADDGESYDEIRYEGYGPGGVAIIVETLTDNKNRTASDVRAAFSKHGGNLGETNSVSFMFERVGSIQYVTDVATADEMFEAALDAGARDVETGDDGHDVSCEPDDFHDVREALEARFAAPVRAALTWWPPNTIELDQAGAEKLFRLLEALEDNDDVQNVSSNFSVSDEILANLTQ